MVEEVNVGETEASRAQPHCVCRELAAHLASVFGIKSDEARGHLLNARIEILKAVRSVIDERIDHLSRAAAKGTRVTVE